MHIFILTDFEGISGVESRDMIDSDNENYDKARNYLMSDTNAAIAGAFAGGADKVSVIDGHSGGLNFIEEKLDSRVVQISADTYYKTKFSEWDVDGFIALGAHAKAGTVCAFLDHTKSSRSWFDYKINGVSYGEIGIHASTFGLIDIPMIMVTGDEATCREAKELVLDVVTVSVKKATERNKAESIPVEEAYELIYNAAKEAVTKVGKIKPYKITLPATVEVTYTRNDYCDRAMKKDPSLIRNGRTVTRVLEAPICFDGFNQF